MMLMASKRLIIPAVALSFSVYQGKEIAVCEKSSEWAFDTKNLPPQVSIPGSSPTYLAGVGIRRKNLYIVNVDVYAVGLALSKSTMDRAIEWAKSDRNSRASLTSIILQNPSSKDNLVASILLKPIRDVTTEQFSSALTDAFVGVDPEKFQAFISLIKKTLGSKGMSPTDLVVFHFMKNGDLVLEKNGAQLGSLNLNEISRRLMDIYIDPSRTVTPDLEVSIEANIEVVKHLALNTA